jgi:hypothetical protein
MYLSSGNTGQRAIASVAIWGSDGNLIVSNLLQLLEE